MAFQFVPREVLLHGGEPSHVEGQAPVVDAQVIMPVVLPNLKFVRRIEAQNGSHPCRRVELDASPVGQYPAESIPVYVPSVSLEGVAQRLHDLSIAGSENVVPDWIFLPSKSQKEQIAELRCFIFIRGQECSLTLFGPAFDLDQRLVQREPVRWCGQSKIFHRRDHLLRTLADGLYIGDAARVPHQLQPLQQLGVPGHRVEYDLSQ